MFACGARPDDVDQIKRLVSATRSSARVSMSLPVRGWLDRPWNDVAASLHNSLQRAEPVRWLSRRVRAAREGSPAKKRQRWRTPILAAWATASVRLTASSFSNNDATWYLAVCVEMPSLRAICLFD